jgi:Carboxypeptidase regulatory-like domain
MNDKGKRMRLCVAALLAVILGAPAIFGQTIDGDVVGTVFDVTGAAVPNARVTLENIATGVKKEANTGGDGTYRFSNVPVGTYTVAIGALGFGGALVKDVQVELNKPSTVNATLQAAAVKSDVTVVEAPVLLNTTTAQIGTTYSERAAEDLAIAANAGDAGLNLALLDGGVASSGGVGAGYGPAVGGQRPRSNYFTVEGVDDNRKDVTGPVLVVPNDAVAEFTSLQNQYSAEFGHSGGGQFNTVIKNGGNVLHGSLFEYFQNRYLNAVDQSYARQGFRSPQRYDNNRFGGEIGGPIKKNSLFYYGLFEDNPVGQQGTLSESIYAPTAAGYQMLNSMPGLSQTNLGVLEKYLAPAPVASYSTTVSGVTIPTGVSPILAPSYYNYYNWLGSIDYTLSSKDQIRGRYLSTRLSQIDTSANLPAFWTPSLTTSDLVSLSEFHTFQSNVLNEVRLAYNRFDGNVPAPNISYPGVGQFPNISIRTDLGVNIGPDPNAPQANTQNTYQFIDNLSWVKGRHDLKFGFEARDQLAGDTFIQYSRGDYEYQTVNTFLLDQVPDHLVRRSVGSQSYSGDAKGYDAFVNDNWRVSSNFSLNLGVRYEYNGVSQSMKDFALNTAANVPGVIGFFAPQAQKLNFAPRFGFAYSPGHKANTTLRGGFGIGYDPIFDNIGQNVRPPQDTSLITSVPNAPNFLANGGISPTPLPSNPTVAQLRALTTGWLPNQLLGYAMNWSLGVQHEFKHDYTLEVRYVGSRGVHLIEQTELNRNSVVTPSLFLPTYLTSPGQAVLNSLPVTLTQLNALAAQNNPLAQYGFSQSITSYEPLGNSIYNGMASSLKKRMSNHLLLQAAYTWSHMRDDSTAEINTTSLSPRRPQDFGNLQSEWADSALDRRQRATLTWIYETPWFHSSPNGFVRNLLGDYQISGSYIFESPEYVTPQGGYDANLNSDATSDRTIVNSNGVPGTGSGVKALTNSSGGTVAYLATNPNAQYILAQVGALANAGRNTLPTEPINNWDLTVAKNFIIRERFRLQFRADFLNAFNHPQYTPGYLDNVSPLKDTATNYLVPGNPLFGQWNQVFASNARYIQLGIKLRF